MSDLDKVGCAIVASLGEQCDFEHVGLIGMHVNWAKVAQAAIDAHLEALQLTESWRAWGQPRTWPTREQALIDRLQGANPYHEHRVSSRLVSPWKEST